MACAAESSSAAPDNDKPVIVRVKRRASQSSLEAFWLEINERPLKRPLLDFESLSLSDSSAKVEEALKVKTVFVQRVETVSSSEVTYDVLQSFVKRDKLLEKAKGQQELLSKNARFEQIWRHRKGKKEAMHDEAIHDICRLYDVVRVDADETSTEVQEKEDLEDDMMMASYLPLLREFIPSAAAEIESGIHDYVSKQASEDDYVYDLYAVKNGISMTEEDASNLFPLVQVDDDDGFYAGPDASEYESDDSNAENNPLNDYPDEESSQDAEVESRTSDDKSEKDESSTASGKSSEDENRGHHDFSDGGDPLFEDDIYSDDDDDSDVYGCDKDDDGDDEDWR
ncbi:hypothetical protein RJ639_043278 [Escallonia herrerae]|uniref:Transcription factor Iwr1 domain-containing protein n=1 Tax=Escallonia herrerae TaxID=1293975 RepID=A0AA89B0L3_9ASTE|nr:hypothetical protein RJ639_043278 [Escallonia herrerae]